MIRWQPRRRSGSFENDDIRRSLEMLDDILAEYDKDSDSGSTNGRSPTENNGSSRFPYAASSSTSSTSHGPPPPPEEAARVIVSYLPRDRYQNGSECPTTSDLIGEEFPPPPPPRDQDVNADACNNNAYVTFEPSNFSVADYAMFDELNPPPKPSPGARSPLSKRQAVPSPESKRGSSAATSSTNRNTSQQQQQMHLESQFPEFREFQLRMPTKGNYRMDDEPTEELLGYVDITSSATDEMATDDYQYQTSYLDESGDSEDRSSEECSSVIEVPLAARADAKDPFGGGGDDGSSTGLLSGDVVPVERPEDYVKVHPKKYFEDCPADTYPPQVYPLDDDRPRSAKPGTGGTVFVLTGQLDSEGDFLPPPPAFDNAADDAEDSDNDRDSPAFLDDAEDIFYDLTRSAVPNGRNAPAPLTVAGDGGQTRNGGGDEQEEDDEEEDERGDEEEDEDDDDEQRAQADREKHDAEEEEDDEEDEDHLGSWEEELLNRQFSALQEELNNFSTYLGGNGEGREEDDATPTNKSFEQLYLEQQDEDDRVQQPRRIKGFKSPPPQQKQDVPDEEENDLDYNDHEVDGLSDTSEPEIHAVIDGSEEDDDDQDDDETDVRWKIPLPPGRPLVFGTTILLKNRKPPQPDGILPSVAHQEALKAKAAKGIAPTTTSEKPEQKAQQQTKGHERNLSAESLGLQKLPDVRGLVDSFNKVQKPEPPPVAERRMSQEMVSTLRRDLPLFTPIRPPSSAFGRQGPSSSTSMAGGRAGPPVSAKGGGGSGGGSSSGSGHSSVPAPMPPMTLSYPTATASLRRRARERSKLSLAGPDGRGRSGREFSVPLGPSVVVPGRSEEGGAPMLLSYRVVDGELPPLPLVKGATLPRPSSHDARKGGHRVAPDPGLAVRSGASPSTKELAVAANRRTPPPPPPLAKGPPPKMFVEVQPSRSESSCTSSCSCLCMKHQSPCNSPVPPPMPNQRLAEIMKGDLKRSSSAPSHEAMAEEHGRCKVRGRGFNSQLKWPRRQQQQQHPQQQVQPQTQALTGASTSTDKISNEPYDALVMEIQAAIQHRKSDPKEGKDDTGSDSGITMMHPMSPSPLSMEKDRSLDRKGLFKGLWRRGRSDEGRN